MHGIVLCAIIEEPTFNFDGSLQLQLKWCRVIVRHFEWIVLFTCRPFRVSSLCSTANLSAVHLLKRLSNACWKHSKHSGFIFIYFLKFNEIFFGCKGGRREFEMNTNGFEFDLTSLSDACFRTFCDTLWDMLVTAFKIIILLVDSYVWVRYDA